MLRYFRTMYSIDEEDILNVMQHILVIQTVDSTFLRQFSAFFTDMHWKLIFKNQNLDEDFIRQFRHKFQKIFNCEDYRALKDKVYSMRQIREIKDWINA